MNSSEFVFFSAFLFLIAVMLVIDLGIFTRKSHKVGFREAFGWSVVWIGISLLFYFFLLHWGDVVHGVHTLADVQERIRDYGHPITLAAGAAEETALAVYRKNLALEYLTGYLIEKSLSVDNIFVIYIIFQSFGVKEIYFKKVLIWGILGAVIMRFIFIFAGAALVREIHEVLYVFGLFLIITAISLFLKRKKKMHIEPKDHFVVRFISKYFRVSGSMDGGKFFTRQNGKLLVTPLFIVVGVVEFSDVIFAVDSIPAIFAVSHDPYIIFYSNVFAILGLRALFFLLANIIPRFHYLKTGLSVLLLFIGLKMIVPDVMEAIWDIKVKIPTDVSLYIILGILSFFILLSVIHKPAGKEEDEAS
ncbi:MAG: TerC/Alx family metal homeostasis membrane protein [Bacteroidales bacterium]|nr:TerC/Alx family metal homeostasis membrane protein [Bacteroidales bacterium]